MTSEPMTAAQKVAHPADDAAVAPIGAVKAKPVKAIRAMIDRYTWYEYAAIYAGIALFLFFRSVSSVSSSAA